MSDGKIKLNWLEALKLLLAALMGPLGGGGAQALFWGMKKQTIPRGLRNNNPLNIRISTSNWVGKRKENTDGVFEQFISKEYGIRAAIILVRRYIGEYGLNTIEKIVSRWAPSNENDTAKYIETVVQKSGINPDRIIKKDDKYTICRILFVMTYVENGEFIPYETFVNVWKLYVDS